MIKTGYSKEFSIEKLKVKLIEITFIVWNVWTHSKNPVRGTVGNEAMATIREKGKVSKLISEENQNWPSNTKNVIWQKWLQPTYPSGKTTSFSRLRAKNLCKLKEFKRKKITGRAGNMALFRFILGVFRGSESSQIVLGSNGDCLLSSSYHTQEKKALLLQLSVSVHKQIILAIPKQK